MAQDFAKAFYNSRAWMKCRDAFMQSKHWMCERCGRIAEECHHKTYLTPYNIDDPYITLNWDRLEALCRSCHSVEHMGSQQIADGLMFDDDGNLKKII